MFILQKKAIPMVHMTLGILPQQTFTSETSTQL